MGAKSRLVVARSLPHLPSQNSAEQLIQVIFRLAKGRLELVSTMDIAGAEPFSFGSESCADPDAQQLASRLARRLGIGLIIVAPTQKQKICHAERGNRATEDANLARRRASARTTGDRLARVPGLVMLRGL